MADIVVNGDMPRPRRARARWVDTGGGAFAPEVAVAPSGRALVVTLHLTATNGDTFSNDSATSYTYDESGLNITSITKTTADGVNYKQTWVRDGTTQLTSKSGWVRQ